MLTQLSIRNFVLAKEIFLDIQAGMTAITGETGAGKSILLNALNLALGGRAEQGIVRANEQRADVSASFDLSNLPKAYKWMQSHDLNENYDCILRRTVSKDGRSRAFINGQQVTLVQLKELGSMLIDIHSQHQHQSLLKPSNHRGLLDDFAGNHKIVAKVKEVFTQWKVTKKKLNDLKASNNEQGAERQLLNYQIDELKELDLSLENIAKLEKIQVTQSQVESTSQSVEASIGLLSDDQFNPMHAIAQCERSLSPLLKLYPQLQESVELLQTAHINVQETIDNLELFSSNIERDPQMLFEAESQLSKIYDMARKHNVLPEQLEEHYELLCNQLAMLDNNQNLIEQLEPQVEQLFAKYIELSEKLSKSRLGAIKKFNKAICDQLKNLNMSGAKFNCEMTALSKEQFNEYGVESVEFEVALNAGQAFTSLQKSASGGELSRISLAIAVICAQKSSVPTMIFDEIDVGISGATAQMVGKLLKQLGEHAQLLCVTHLSQVASQANQHWLVAKNQVAGQTISSICPLLEKDRTHEIARMIGGIDITDQSLAYANEILNVASPSLQ